VPQSGNWARRSILPRPHTRTAKGERTGRSTIRSAHTSPLTEPVRLYPLGRNLLPGSASSGRRVNGRSLELTDKIKGKVTHTEEVNLSLDLKTLTTTVHPAGQSKPNILVFTRE
jgi:hypothetical protein